MGGESGAGPLRFERMLLFTLERLLRARLAGSLPGLAAHERFAAGPGGARLDPAQPRTAAALLLLYPYHSAVALPLTLRAEGLTRHAGQISLPGGASDPGEAPTETALREAEEELGIDPGSVRVLGELTPVHVVVSGFTLHPVVGVTDRRPAFVPAPAEVAEVLEVPLEDLRDASRIRRGTRIREGVVIEYPYFDRLGHHVWGATAMVLGELICLLQEERQM